MIDAVEIEQIAQDYDPCDKPVERVHIAQRLINAAIDILSDVVKETNDRNAEAYVVDHLRILAGSDHGFLDRSMNLDKWIERLEDRDDEDED